MSEISIFFYSLVLLPFRIDKQDKLIVLDKAELQKRKQTLLTDFEQALACDLPDDDYDFWKGK